MEFEKFRKIKRRGGGIFCEISRHTQQAHSRQQRCCLRLYIYRPPTTFRPPRARALVSRSRQSAEEASWTRFAFKDLHQRNTSCPAWRTLHLPAQGEIIQGPCKHWSLLLDAGDVVDALLDYPPNTHNRSGGLVAASLEEDLGPHQTHGLCLMRSAG